MINTLGLEYFKNRRKKIWIMILLFLVIEMLWAFMSISHIGIWYYVDNGFGFCERLRK